MPSLSKLFATLLALVVVGDARAATFTTKTALQTAVNACIGKSSVGNCCAPSTQTNPVAADIVIGTGGDREGICAVGNTHLQNWDVSSVTDMINSKLSSVASCFRVLCLVVQRVRLFGVISLFSLSALLYPAFLPFSYSV